MSINSFVWRGGATGSTSAERFSWNVPSNWLIREGIQYVINRTGKLPGPYDLVYLGTSEIWLKPTSPLLYGGFLGGSTGGHWGGETYSFTTGGIGGPGLTGTTYNSHLDRFQIDGGVELQGSIAYPWFNYPFPIIGGGLTGNDTIEILKGCNVVGMTLSDWDSLAANCTPFQSSLRIKTDGVLLLGDQTSTLSTKSAAPQWNDYSTQESWEKYYSDYKHNKRQVNLTLVDNLVGVSLNSVATAQRIDNVVLVKGTGIELNLKDSKLINVNTDVVQKGWRDWGYKIIRNGRVFPPSISLDNCVVSSIFNVEYPYHLTTYPNCTIGFVKSVLQKGSWNDTLVPGGITWDDREPYHTLSGVFSSKSVTVLLNPGNTFSANAIENTRNLDYDHRSFVYATEEDETGGVRNPVKTIIKLGDKTLNPSSSTGYVSGATFAVYDAYFRSVPDYVLNNPWNVYENTVQLEIGNSGKIETLTVEGTNVYGSVELQQNDTIAMMNCNLENYSNFAFNHSPHFKNWRFGLITGTTYSGGLIFGDNSTSTITGNEGLRLLNYGVYGKSVNSRNNVIYDIATASPPIREEI